MPASYFLQKPSGHFFRFQFPKDIKPFVGRSEIRYSLWTGKLSFIRPVDGVNNKNYSRNMDGITVTYCYGVQVTIAQVL